MTRQWPRWTILELIVLVIFVAIAVAGYKTFWVSSGSNYSIVFGAYLWVLTLATLAARLARQWPRRACLGYATFGWAYLLFVLRGGVGIETFAEAKQFNNDCLVGMIFGLLAAIAVWACTAGSWSGR